MLFIIINIKSLDAGDRTGEFILPKIRGQGRAGNLEIILGGGGVDKKFQYKDFTLTRPKSPGLNISKENPSFSKLKECLK
jgi:hypothetical protein